MQGQILTMGGGRSLILGDDGVRYTFAQQEWQNDDVEAAVGVRVDFEVRGSDAVEIYPVPGAPPSEPSPAPSASSDMPAAARDSGRMLRDIRDELHARYDPVRRTIGNYGVIAVGIVLLAVSAFIRFDLLEVVVDVISMAGMVVGISIAAVGIYMLGKEDGWWDRSSESGRQGIAGSPSPPPGAVPRSHAESRGAEIAGARTPQPSPRPPTEHRRPPSGSPGTAKRMKTCPSCAKSILYEAIKCRYCRSDVPGETGPA